MADDDVERVDVGAALVWAAAPVIVNDVVRRIVHVAALAVVAPPCVVLPERVDDAIHELPRPAAVLTRVPERSRKLRGDLIHHGRHVR